jgi:hypothetical protein
VYDSGEDDGLDAPSLADIVVVRDPVVALVCEITYALGKVIVNRCLLIMREHRCDDSDGQNMEDF